MRRAALALAATFILTAACTTGISRDEAIRLALGSRSSAQAISAEPRMYAGEPRDPVSPRMAWIVRLTGDFPISCPPSAQVCADVHHAEIVLDFYSGEFIAASYF